MFGKHFRFLAVLSIAALGLTVAPASASVITYSTLASWQAASSGDQTIDFTGSAPSTNPYPGLTFLGVQFFGSPDNLGIMDTSDPATPWYNFGTGKAAYVFTNNGTNMQIKFPTAVTAFALNLFSNTHALNFTLNINGTPYSVQTNDIGSPLTFFGITSTTPFATNLFVSSATSGAFLFVDNVSFGTAQLPTDPTPEAATLLLIGSGLIGLMVLRKRILKNKPALQTNPILSAC